MSRSELNAHHVLGQLATARSYDVWGSVRSGSSTGYPNTRYCANLGHKQDDESGLLYMRARYYEPWTGRFITEDPARDGWNWFIYCGSDPVSNVDRSGKEYEDDSFDPVYYFKWWKWSIAYSLLWTLHLNIAVSAWLRGPGGVAGAIALWVLRAAHVGGSIIELWGLRTALWWLLLFEDVPPGMLTQPIIGDLPIVGFYDGPLPDPRGGQQ